MTAFDRMARSEMRRVFVAAVVGTILAALPAAARAQGVFIRGDCDQTLGADITDPILALNYLFAGGREPACLDACDTNDSGTLDISDPIALLGFLFLGSDPPPMPFPLEDIDPTEDALTCLNGVLPFVELRLFPRHLILRRLEETATLSLLGVEHDGDLADVRLHAATRYASEDPAIATVDGSGLVTARSAGTTMLRALHRGVTAEARVTVLESASGAPEVRFTAPAAGLDGEPVAVLGGTIGVAGIVTDPQAALSLRIDGGGAEPIDNIGGRFNLRLELEPGEHSLTATAAGAAGASSASLALRVLDPGDPSLPGPDGAPLPRVPLPRVAPPDTTPPRVRITSPKTGARLESLFVTVRGTVDDPEAEVRVDGVPAPLDGLDFAVESLRLARGRTAIEVVATDRVGNASSHRVEVEVAPVVPRIVLRDPPGTGLRELDGFLVSGSASFELHGNVTPAAARVSAGGVPAVLAGSAFRVQLMPGPGLHEVVVTAWSADGAPLVQSVHALFADIEAPRIEVLHPPDGFTTSRETLRIAGRVHDPGAPLDLSEPITVSLDDGQSVAASGCFVLDAALAPGANILELRARDGRGHESTATLHVTRAAGGAPELLPLAGDRQTVAAGEDLPEPLAIEARTGAGQLEAGLAVTFRVLAGSGRFADGSRVHAATTDARGQASVRFQAGREVGAGSQAIAVTAEGPSTAGAVFISDTTAPPSRHLVAHRGRRRAGTAAEPLAEPLSVRLLDGFGNPVPGETVAFTVAGGEAVLEGGAVELARTTDANGIARAGAVLPAGDSLSRVVAEASGSRVRFELAGLEPSAPGETTVEGWVADDHGLAVSGALVRVAGIEGPPARTGPRGEFSLAGVPSGHVVFEVATGPESTSGRAAFPVVSGRWNRLPSPLRVTRSTGSLRTRVQLLDPARGAAFTLAALPGLRLDVAPGSAVFPDGGREGLLRVSMANARVLAKPSPGDAAVRIPLVVSPHGVRFDPPARLVLPNPGYAPGRIVPLFEEAASGFQAAAAGVVSPDGDRIDVLPGHGLRRSGAVFFELAGSAGGPAGSLEGEVALRLPRLVEVPARERSHVAGVNVYTHSGEFFLEAVDLEVPGRGLPYRFRRRYESRHAFRGSLGWNWEHEYADRRLERSPSSGNVVRADGAGRFDEYLHDAASGEYVSPIGVFSKLFPDGEGFLVERLPDGTRYRYFDLDGSATAGLLASIADRAGNTLRMERGADGRLAAVFDTLGRRIEYAYDAAGRIASVTDFTGRRVAFEFDARGDLAAAIGPAVTGTPNGNDFPAGRRTEYAYSSGYGDLRLDHNLVEWIEPREVLAGTRRPRLVNHYRDDPVAPDADRVIAQDTGGVNDTGVSAGGRYAFEYEDLSTPSGGPVDAAALERHLAAAAARTRITGACGDIVEVVSNGAGLPLSVRAVTREDGRPRDPSSLHPPPGVKPPWYETRYRWTREGLLARVELPRGNGVEYVYDDAAPLRYSRGHAVLERRFPAPAAEEAAGTGGEDSTAAVLETTLRAYDPLFAEPVLTVPPGAGGEPDPARATRRFLDYQEAAGIEKLARSAGVSSGDLAAALEHAAVDVGLGDLNGDGTVEQRIGRTVREELPPAPDAGARTWTYNAFGQLTSRRDASGRIARFEYHPESDPEGDGTAIAGEGLDGRAGGYLARRIVDPEGQGDAEPLALAESWSYDARGNLARHRDPAGHEVHFLHNALGELVEVRRGPPLGYRTQYSYDADGRLAASRTENLRQNDAGTHLIVSANRWIETELERDLLGNVIAVTREVSGGEVGPEKRISTAHRYDACGRRVAVLHPVPGTEESWELDERGLVIAHTRGAGTAEASRRETYRDENGNPVLEVDASDSDGDGGPERTERRYDGHDRVRAIIDAAGGARVFERLPGGLVAVESFVGAAGGPTPSAGEVTGAVLLSRTRRAWDARGRLRELRRELFGAGARDALVERTEYDEEGRVVSRTAPGGREEVRSYDGAGRLTGVRDSAGNATERWFDRAGNIVKERVETVSEEPIDPTAAGDPDYDAEGRLVLIAETVWVHDALGRLTVLVGNDGGTWRVRYDSLGNPILVSDSTAAPTGAGAEPELAGVLDLLSARQRSRVNGPGNRLRLSFDNLGRLVESTAELRREGSGDGALETTNGFNPDGLVTERYEWDDNHRLVAWTDDRGARTAVERDALGSVRRKTWVDGSAATWECDRDGNPVRHVDRGGSIVVQRYDALHRVVAREVTPRDGVEGTVRQLFEYDGLGRLTLAWDGNRPEDPADDALVLRRYDSAGRLRGEWAGGFELAFEHDGAGRITAWGFPDGAVYLAERGSGGGIAALTTEGGGLLARYRRFASGRMIDGDFAGGLRTSFLQREPSGIERPGGYDALGRVVAIENLDAGGRRLFGYEYGRSARGLPLWERHLHRSAIGDVWRYDSLYRLELFLPDVFDPRAPPPFPERFTRYFLDGNHNWRQLRVDQSDRFVTADALDRYTAFGTDVLGYGPTGNLEQHGNVRYIYDAFDRLVRVERSGAAVVRIAYDAVGAEDPWSYHGRGRRASRDVLAPARGQPAGIVRYLYSEERIAEERGADGGLLRRMLHGDDGLPAVLLRPAPGMPPRAAFFLLDGNGSTAAVAGADGGLDAAVRYGVQGEPRISNSLGNVVAYPPSGASLLFRGLPWDFETALRAEGARYFAPALGRFLTRDARIAPRRPFALNAYGFPLPARSPGLENLWAEGALPPRLVELLAARGLEGSAARAAACVPRPPRAMRPEVDGAP